MRLFKKSNLLHILYRNAITYPAPSNLTYFWNFGFLSLIALVIQILTGIFLAMHYTGNIDYAFNSVEHIMRDVNNGWLIRYVHANGASLFFLLVYIHMFRGMYYSSYAKPREFLWIVGVIILLIMILTAFMGYVLPWGQMSFWAATVITNLASAIPVVGLSVVEWLWGGFSVGNPTLNRFFSFHYLFPFVLVGLVLVHIILLHEKGSNNPLGIDFRNDLLPFDPYFTIKDFFSLILVFILLFIFVAFMPNVAGHPDNYIPANPMVTPTHIVPEWYFLPFYAILRSVPDKLGGVTLLLLSILILILLPFIHRPVVRSFLFRPLSKFFFWFFFFNCLILGWIGGQPIEPPYLEVGRYSTVFYFVYLVILLPGVNLIEKTLFGFTDK